jgi:Leucine-rich repeat (LRR) protein|tara:strand:- start:82 stop:528 length:447 start_codon:yes stop_codon:yes gene_type:complete
VYQLVSLEHISIIGGTEKKTRTIRDGTTEFMLSKNQLTSLLPLALDEGSKMFAKMEKIDARYNTISAICAEQGDLLRNEWPYKMVCLTDLDLSHNQLSSIPNLKTMPALKILKLAHNKIRPPWKQLKEGKNLEHLELHENRLGKRLEI